MSRLIWKSCRKLQFWLSTISNNSSIILRATPIFTSNISVTKNIKFLRWIVKELSFLRNSVQEEVQSWLIILKSFSWIWLMWLFNVVVDYEIPNQWAVGEIRNYKRINDKFSLFKYHKRWSYQRNDFVRLFFKKKVNYQYLYPNIFQNMHLRTAYYKYLTQWCFCH